MSPELVPLVLAAGASTRMGEAKALLKFGGRSALAHIVATSAAAGLAPPVVVIGYHADVVRAEAEELGCRVAVNPRPERGQTSSLQAGVATLLPTALGFLLWPVDVPLVLRATLAAIVGASREADVIVPRHGGRRGHPALFARSLTQRFLELAPDEPANTVARRSDVTVREVDVSDPHVLDRINTPEDYQRIAAAWGG